jgi:D-amino-acid oxidase
MPRAALDALVIGAGVSGLTTAVCLAEGGARVAVWSADPPRATTSAAAGAMWVPYLAESDRVRAWSGRTLDELRRLEGRADTGVRLVPGVQASRTPVDPPDWADQIGGLTRCEPDDLPPGYATGWRFTAVLVDMPAYLGYLQRRLADAGTAVQIRRLSTLDEAVGAAPVVVNCTGIGARELVPDLDVVPSRGQVVVVENPGITEFFADEPGLEADLLYILPHGPTVVLGGIAATGEWNLRADPAVAAAIVERCAGIDPRLREARVLEHRVGLRPTRTTVRVQEQRRDGVRLIHNYGHGGSGVTLSWGCAADVAAMVHIGR